MEQWRTDGYLKGNCCEVMACDGASRINEWLINDESMVIGWSSDGALKLNLGLILIN